MLEEAEEEEVRGEAGCLEVGQGAEAGLCKAELSCRKELTVKSESQGQLVEVWDKKEDGGAGREPSLNSIWEREAKRRERGKAGEEPGPCLARENQLGDPSPLGQSGNTYCQFWEQNRNY